MSQKFLISGTCCLCFILGDTALAQINDLYKVSGGVGGNAGAELSRIRRGDIGTGYTADNVNQQSLNRASISTPYVGGSTSRTTVGAINRTYNSGSSQARPAASFGVGSAGPASKPFTGISTRPTVSPYLNLFREGLDGFSDFNYQTLVRPQVQQMEVNQNLQRQQQEINRKVQSLSARQAFNPQGSTQQMPTGHQTIFNNLSHYYPSAGRRR